MRYESDTSQPSQLKPYPPHFQAQTRQPTPKNLSQLEILGDRRRMYNPRDFAEKLEFTAIGLGW
ncbi:hypothetical protein KAU88_06205 [Candidatus Bathyarchaeota archaeon]|nr:hypothetical protein [Candidatus Bathyarchaeota archaeon]